VAGSGELFIVIAKELRDKISKQAGDVVKMTLGLDTSTDAVNVPVDLKKALSTNEKAKSSFGRMAPIAQESLPPMDHSSKDHRNKGEPDWESSSTDIRRKNPEMMKTHRWYSQGIATASVSSYIQMTTASILIPHWLSRRSGILKRNISRAVTVTGDARATLTRFPHMAAAKHL
jgi:hypothetical protein